MKLYSHSQRGRVAARILSLSALVLGGGLILTGCPTGATLEDSDQFLSGSSSPGGDGDGDAQACDALPIFEQGCSGSICHGDDSGDLPSGGVDLINPGVAARLLDIDATYPGVSGCPDIPEKLVDSTSLEASLLWTKLNNTQICGDGMPIPHSAVALPESDMECVRSWMQDIITNGAGAAPPGGGGASGDGDASATGGSNGSGGTPSTGGTSSMGGMVRVEAECALGAGDCGGVTGSATAGVMLENGDTTVGFFNGGESLTYSGVVTDGQDTLTLQLAKGNMGGTVEIRLDSATGTLVGSHSPANTGDWTTFTPVEVALTQPLTGTQTIVLVATDQMAGVLNLDWFELSTGAAQ